MKIDATRYSKFWANPERYRLSQLCKLSPCLPRPGTMARTFMRGRMRGSAFHEIMQYGRVTWPDIYTPEELAAAEEMADLARSSYPDEKPLAVEQEFTYQIPESLHAMAGRIDSIVQSELSGLIFIADWKTCGKCTKKELEARIAAYMDSPQVPFYLIGARTLGYDIRDFQYRIVQAGKIHERWVRYTKIQLDEFARQVHMTCSIIEMMVVRHGFERSWPRLHEKYTTGYETIANSKMYPGYIPDGFETRKEHLSLDEQPEDAI